MNKLARSLLYFGLGSLAAGTVCGIGFSVNLGRRMRAWDQERLNRLGQSRSLTLKSIEGILVWHADRPRPTIVLVHGRSANPMEVFPIAEAMVQEGFNVVLVTAVSTMANVLLTRLLALLRSPTRSIR